MLQNRQSRKPITQNCVGSMLPAQEWGETQHIRAMLKAYPPDVEFVQALELDCLQPGGDVEEGVVWRSVAERDLFRDIRGWESTRQAAQTFVPLRELVTAADGAALECLTLLQSIDLRLDTKLQRAASALDCPPTITSVGEALSQKLLHVFSDDVETVLERYTCRLCGREAGTFSEFEDHVASGHLMGADASRAHVEYRKKVLGLLDHAGPMASRLKG